ncbi:MAG: hypothetical protein KF709_01875 [Gemmatimonadaceae bacterium]|nr:hypothetical protein [Gemmatimonadaceae bacterium]
MSRFRSIAVLAAFSIAAVAAGVATHDLTGRWTLAVVTENGTGYPTVDLTQTGDSVHGTYTSNAMGSRTLRGTVERDTLRFVLSSSMGGEGVVLTYIARIVTPDSLNGIVDFGGMGSAQLTGQRVRR